LKPIRFWAGGGLKDILVSAVVALALLYAVDSYWFSGKYFAAANSMLSRVIHHARG
jgi:hypothetical protein